MWAPLWTLMALGNKHLERRQEPSLANLETPNTLKTPRTRAYMIDGSQAPCNREHQSGIDCAQPNPDPVCLGLPLYSAPTGHPRKEASIYSVSWGCGPEQTRVQREVV